MSRRLLLLGTLSWLLAGCASMPLGLQVASLAGSALSYKMTGKSLSDHALSVATEQDCAFMRLLDVRPPCRAYPALKANDPVSGVPPLKPSVAAADSAPAAREVIILGRFRSHRNASAVAANHRQLGQLGQLGQPGALAPRVGLARRRDGVWYEVRLGPYSPAQSRAVRQRLVAVGVRRFDVEVLAAGPPSTLAMNAGQH